MNENPKPQGSELGAELGVRTCLLCGEIHITTRCPDPSRGGRQDYLSLQMLYVELLRKGNLYREALLKIRALAKDPICDCGECPYSIAFDALKDA